MQLPLTSSAAARVVTERSAFIVWLDRNRSSFLPLQQAPRVSQLEEGSVPFIYPLSIIPLFTNCAPWVLSGDLKPGLDAAHMLKDLRVALAEAQGRLSLPGAALTTQLFEQLVKDHARLGNHALNKAYAS
jgi:hypothetical protein